MSDGNAPRILIIKTHAIGDLLMTTPAIRDIRRAYPHAHIALLVGKWSSPAVRHNPHLDELIEVEDDVLLGRRKPWLLLGLLWRVRRLRFDKAFIFHPLPMIHLFARLAGIASRYGLLGGQGSRHLTAGVQEDLGPETYYPVNFLNVVALDGVKTGEPQLEVYASAPDDEAADRTLREVGVDPANDFVLVAPGGGRNSKEDVAARRWPAEKFAELLRITIADHPGLKVVLTGSGLDAPDTAAVAAAVPGAIDLTGRTSLPQLFVLAGRARAVVCNDSSLLHIAVAQGTPVVAPFGPTGARQRVPASAMSYVVQSDLPCSPCYVGGQFPGCGIGYACMTEISVATMRARMGAALAHRPLRARV